MLTASSGKNLRRHSERQQQQIKESKVLVQTKVDDTLTFLLQKENLSESQISFALTVIRQSQQYLFLNLPLLAKVISYILINEGKLPSIDQVNNYFPHNNAVLDQKVLTLMRQRHYFNFLRYYRHFMDLSRTQDN
jgi:hypothetical protein